MSGPVPSHLVLLSDLPVCEAGTKVRFLGCVDEYIVKTATLRLKHNYPLSSAPVIANVNIDHVLERVKYDQIDVGAWVNVIGYVGHEKERGSSVQAIALWSAGNIDLRAYVDAIERRKGIV